MSILKLSRARVEKKSACQSPLKQRVASQLLESPLSLISLQEARRSQCSRLRQESLKAAGFAEFRK